MNAISVKYYRYSLIKQSTVRTVAKLESTIVLILLPKIIHANPKADHQYLSLEPCS